MLPFFRIRSYYSGYRESGDPYGTKPEPGRRLAPVARAARRRRIFARLRLGWTHEEIGRAERLSRQRIGQIVRQGPDSRAIGCAKAGADRRAARFPPALGAAPRAVARDDLAAIDLLLRVLDRLDRRSEAAEGSPYCAEIYQRLLAKLDAARRLAEAEAGAATAAETSQ
jgi:hypothetical protein